MHRNVILVGLLLLGVSACSDDSSGSGPVTNDATAPTTVAQATLPPNETNPLTGDTFGPQTTFMADCGRMPTTADLLTATGVPFGEGLVSGPATCDYLGLNDQSKSITLSIFSTPEEIAEFNDLLASTGTPTPLNDPAVPDAQISPDYSVFVTANNAIYVVRTRITGADPTAEVAPAAAILAKWLAL